MVTSSLATAGGGTTLDASGPGGGTAWTPPAPATARRGWRVLPAVRPRQPEPSTHARQRQQRGRGGDEAPRLRCRRVGDRVTSAAAPSSVVGRGGPPRSAAALRHRAPAAAAAPPASPASSAHPRPPWDSSGRPLQRAAVRLGMLHRLEKLVHVLEAAVAILLDRVQHDRSRSPAAGSRFTVDGAGRLLGQVRDQHLAEAVAGKRHARR